MNEREQFEAWHRAAPGYPYAGAFLNIAWNAWRAARASITKPTEGAVTDEQVFASFRQNCVNYTGNYEVTPGQAVMIVRAVLALAAPAQQPADKDGAQLSREHQIAIVEAHHVTAADKYFNARNAMLDTRDRRNVFEAGFKAGFAAMSSDTHKGNGRG